MDCIVSKISASNLVMEELDDFGKGVAEELARSIEFDGMIHRPVVRPSKDSLGSYVVVAGRNARLCRSHNSEVGPSRMRRLGAGRRVRRVDRVRRECLPNDTVPGSQDQGFDSVAPIYEVRFPRTDGRLAKRRTAANDPAAPQADKSGEQPEACVVAGAADTKACEQTAKPFARVLEKTFGISTSAAKRLDRVGAT